MSSAWTARQGEVGDLSSKSKDQLLEILSRQEKLLSNKRFIQTLPDKGKKIADFVEKVHLALGHLEEEERKQASLISVRTEFQAKYQHALAERSTDKHLDSNVDMIIPSRDRNKANVNINMADIQENGGLLGQEESLTSKLKAAGTLETAGENAADSLMKDTELVEAFGQVTLDESNSGSNQDAIKIVSPSKPFLGNQHQKKPHYIEVLEKTEKSVNIKKSRFKPNQLAVKSESSSPSQASGSTTPLTAEARRQRDRKHLDDITAAKLPPLHHSPAQLLPLEESAALLQEQTRKHLELQAKQAAQKLADGLSFKMESYNPEGGPLAAYREVHDDGAQLSSEED
ncbi:DNA-directed RNA polymerase II subunit GRINL1A-like protein [Labeo rohita]|uniref:DNA-directed RNA polymerase II subunit GRINL1A n=2 Tax=Labeo rohita TaxID=84645 RepID=A0ABQ8MLB7_LABRO|nr:protein GRINL1A [Labeo rohita]KAI2662668.1 DNA-directed RNA polymerase II subunit GRINL1A [Labeo rohita]RXN04139.1 DNA-directed RNA polymerase II subunit GRINL1A-like protein [Labeo rohita]